MQLFSDDTALRSHFEWQANLLLASSQKAIDTLRLISDMNLTLMRQEIEGALYASRDIMSSSDPVHMAQAAMRQIAPAAERLRSYQQHLMAVLSGSQASLAALAGGTEARVPAAGGASTVADDVLQRTAASRDNIISKGNGSTSAAGETHH